MPAAVVLRLQAPILALTYVAMVCAAVLTAMGKGWWVTRTSVVSMVLNSAINLTLARPFLAWFGPVGGACAAALGLFTCEVVAVVLLVGAVGRRAFDRQSLTRLLKTLGVCAVVTGVHVALVGLGPLRLVVGAILYLFLVFATGAVRLDELQGLLRVVRRRGAPARPPPRELELTLMCRPNSSAFRFLRQVLPAVLLALSACYTPGRFIWVDDYREPPSLQDEGYIIRRGRQALHQGVEPE